ncbi:GntR family transcriptional repressor for pyruvate dehydrogenase complex [Paraburkholderia bannensis]|uniref:Pyruvate dehydrogenase complex repressor n=2 Tax=Burkholderiaceae TaxID=119060 RepID=A0A7W9WQF1_9BURK|nr:GntR family transcriptional repressor for pyruvate dehydrogenase complex [Paraburkholderia sp. WP4_3_2]MBB6102030.1 GntR family transcriptional repressor for pyruvate dehydrogenase complex [Paraburkholderia bannensis]
MRDRAGAHGRVETVMRRMETALLDGSWRAGEKLPSERVLAQDYGVARNTVREAIQRLAARGLVASRAGAGVFVTDQLRTGFASPWGQLVADHPALRDDILEFRRVLEGATAYFAALRASDDDLVRIRSLMDELERTRESDDKGAEADADAKLHEVIAQASHNAMFLHLHTSVLGVLREHITINGTGLREQNEDASGLLLLQHRTLCDAILARRPEEARTAMQTHIDFVRARVGEESGLLETGPTSERALWPGSPKAIAAPKPAPKLAPKPTRKRRASRTSSA